ncbi:sensor histidine kinase [Streptomyces sp. NPDC050504]|uniref:sensor histidine kinase n=1 Tax=Streptomyces sp. NPDC050504 TaxID=3365618 RepID=UPI0037B513D4
MTTTPGAVRFVRRAERKARREAGCGPELGPPPTGFTLLPWLLLGMGSLSNLLQGNTPDPWIGGAGLLVFNSLYVAVVFRAFDRRKRESRATLAALSGMGVVTFALALGYGGSWQMFFPLHALAWGAVLRGKDLPRVILPLAVASGAASAVHDGWGGVTIGYSTLLAGMVTSVILALSEAVRELRATREELARSAVEQERLRFSRDLHDLLGHTLSVIVVKSEAARRLAPRDLEAALGQVSDIESVGRQALTEIREAVTGYREGSLATELDRAVSALTAAGIEPLVRRSGPPLDPRTEALLGWVVREAVTNAVRHSGAAHCDITVGGGPGKVLLTVLDDGGGGGGTDGGGGGGTGGSGGTGSADRPGTGGTGTGTGTGLKGLTERLAAAGGVLDAGPLPRSGFRVSAELPVEAAEAEVAAESAVASRTLP